MRTLLALLLCRERWDGLLPVPFGEWTSLVTMAVPSSAKRGTPPPRRAAA